MPTEFLPIIHNDKGIVSGGEGEMDHSLYNCMPWPCKRGEIGACPRYQFDTVAGIFTPSSSSNDGRGLASFDGYDDLAFVDGTYYYSGGSASIVAGNSFADLLTVVTQTHNIAGVTNLIIQNAGDAADAVGTAHGNMWYVADAVSSPTRITDADMPGNNGVSMIRGVVSLDGYLFVADYTGKIYNSDLNSVTAWSGDFITAERESDYGCYLGKHHDHVVYIGFGSIEFFYNAGNASGSPLARRQDIAYRTGCIYPNTVLELGDVIYFVGLDGEGVTKIYKMDNFQLTVISDMKMENLLRGGEGRTPRVVTSSGFGLLSNSRLRMSSMRAAPGNGLILTNSAYWTQYYHEPTGVWCPWSFNGDMTYKGDIESGYTLADVFPIVACNNASSFWPAGTADHAVGDTRYQLSNGQVISIRHSANPHAGTMNDMGESNAPDVHMIFPKWDAGTDLKKRIRAVRVITDSDGVTDTLNATLRWLDFHRDNGGSVTVPTDYAAGRTVNVSQRGATARRLGTTRERRFMLDFPNGKGNITVVKGLEIDYEIVGE